MTALAAPAAKTLNVGDRAPEFHLETDRGPVSVGSLKGKKIVLYFYPKDDTPGCTIEAKDFRDTIKDFDAANATIIGVSRDSLASHEKFRQKYCLPFALGADESGEVCQAFGVWVEKSMYGKAYMGIERSTFLIDGQGVIRNIWRKVKVDGHVMEVLKAAQALG